MTDKKLKQNLKTKGNDFMKRTIAIALSLLFVFLAVLLSGCNENEEPQVKNQEANQAKVSSEVKSNEAAKISLDSAIDIALKDAGVEREKALFQGTPSLDKDDAKPHYDIEFKYDNVEYDYEIALENGSVLRAEKEVTIKAEKESKEIQVSEKAQESVNVKAEKKDSAEKVSSVQPKKESSYISIEKAKEIALNNAGVKQTDAVFKKAYFDSDDMVAHFDIKFVANGYEYEYEIKASNGAILEKDIEREPVRETVSKDSESAYISKDEAKSIAFAHAKVDSANVKYSKAELDKDDLIVHYEIEFVAGNYEYEYEINAETGKIIAFNKEFDD